MVCGQWIPGMQAIELKKNKLQVKVICSLFVCKKKTTSSAGGG